MSNLKKANSQIKETKAIVPITISCQKQYEVGGGEDKMDLNENICPAKVQFMSQLVIQEVRSHIQKQTDSNM